MGPASCGRPAGGDGGVAVLIPALNEAAALPRAMVAIPERFSRRVVVDNGSTDGTGAVARSAGAQVVHEPRRGYGSACLAGVRHLRHSQVPPEVILFLDADHRQSAEEIERVVEPATRGEADLVLGVRTARSGAAQREGAPVIARRLERPLHARIGTAGVLLLVRLLHGARFRDLPPLRAIRIDALDRLGMDDPDFGWTLQMQLRAHHRGLRVKEVEVEHRDRARGRSKISGSLSASLLAGWKMARLTVAERGRR